MQGYGAPFAEGSQAEKHHHYKTRTESPKIFTKYKPLQLCLQRLTESNEQLS